MFSLHCLVASNLVVSNSKRGLSLSRPCFATSNRINTSSSRCKSIPHQVSANHVFSNAYLVHSPPSQVTSDLFPCFAWVCFSKPMPFTSSTGASLSISFPMLRPALPFRRCAMPLKSRAARVTVHPIKSNPRLFVSLPCPSVASPSRS